MPGAEGAPETTTSSMGNAFVSGQDVPRGVESLQIAEACQSVGGRQGPPAAARDSGTDSITVARRSKRPPEGRSSPPNAPERFPVRGTPSSCTGSVTGAGSVTPSTAMRASRSDAIEPGSARKKRARVGAALTTRSQSVSPGSAVILGTKPVECQSLEDPLRTEVTMPATLTAWQRSKA